MSAQTTCYWGPSCVTDMLSLNTSTFQTSFPHPSDTSIRVNILLDACHMLKLVRNTLADRGVLFDAEGGRISWGFIESLDTLQEEGLRLGNRLKKSHIQWRKQKMKVNLVAQAFSASVADALESSDTVLALPQCSDSAATVKFLRIFDELFDALNSRNPFGTGFKAPMRKTNRDRWQKALDTADKYIRQMKDTDGRQVTEGKRRTGFVGFRVCFHSVKAIFDTLVACDDPPMQYLTTYKFSQDHLELFFSSVRARGGYNNNPTVLQFKAAYKRLLMRHSIKTTGNCIIQDSTHIFKCHARHIISH